jgi:hypothetical protein
VVDAFEDLRPLYRIMVALGVVGILILALGFAVLLRFAPPGQRSGYRAQVVGVFACDPSSCQPGGQPLTRFHRAQRFTAKVDWSGLPREMIVGARWTDSLDDDVGTLPPEPAGRLADEGTLIPISTPPEFHENLPGLYTLTVVRYAGGQPVELLARTSVVVLRDT